MSSRVSTPPDTANDDLTLPLSTAAQVRGRRPISGDDSSKPDTTSRLFTSMSGCRKRLNITRPSAPASHRDVATSPKLLKYGDSFTATGMFTTSFTARRISTWRSSTSRPVIDVSPGTR